MDFSSDGPARQASSLTKLMKPSSIVSALPTLQQRSVYSSVSESPPAHCSHRCFSHSVRRLSEPFRPPTLISQPLIQLRANYVPGATLTARDTQQNRKCSLPSPARLLQAPSRDALENESGDVWRAPSRCLSVRVKVSSWGQTSKPAVAVQCEP